VVGGYSKAKGCAERSLHCQTFYLYFSGLSLIICSDFSS
jgi:hypothetical protein